MEIVKTDRAPAAIGPYSQAVKSGDLVFCSGQIPLLESGELLDGDITAQTHQVLKNLGAVLEAAGSSFEKVLKVTVFVADMNDFGAVNLVYSEYFTGSAKPARACVEVSRLPKSVAVEIDCIASLS